MWILGAIMGLVVGAMMGSVAGAIMLACLGGVIVHVATRDKEDVGKQSTPRANRDQSQIDDLRRRVFALESRLQTLEIQLAKRDTIPEKSVSEPDHRTDPAPTAAPIEAKIESPEIAPPLPPMPVLAMARNSTPAADWVSTPFPDTFDTDTSDIENFENAVAEAPLVEMSVPAETASVATPKEKAKPAAESTPSPLAAQMQPSSPAVATKPLITNAPAEAPARPAKYAAPHISAPVSPQPARRVSEPPKPPKPAIPLRERLPEPISRLIYGGNTLVKIGVFILFLGLAFLLRYTAERVTVPIELRYAGVALVGAGLLGLGWFLRRRRADYALTLQGMGVGVFYLTTLAAMKFHSLIPSEMGFGFMFAVSLLGAALAILQKAPILAIIAALEGFATPVLISTGSNQMMALFTYLSILDVGIVLIAWFNAWRILNVIGFVGTFTLASGWADQYYTNEQYAPVQAFLILFFLLFTAVGVLFARRTLLDSRLKLDDEDGLARNAGAALAHVGRVDSALVFGTPLTAFGLQYVLAKPWEFGPAFSAMALSAFYLLLARVIFSKERRGLALLAEAYGIVGVIFGTLAIPLGLEGLWTGAAWAVEGAGMYWLGARQNRPYARAFAYLVMLGASYKLLQTVQYTPDAVGPLLHGSTIGPVLLAASTFAVWWLHHRAKVEDEADWEAFPSSLVLWIGMASLTLLTWQWLPPIWAAAAMTALAVLTHFVARRLDPKAFVGIIAALQALSLIATVVKLWQTTHLNPAADGSLLIGSTTSPVLLAISAFVIYWQYQRARREDAAHLEAIPGGMVLWLGMGALALLPWQWLVPHWAAASMTALAVLTYFVAQRIDPKAFVGIIGTLQALSLISAGVKLWYTTHLNQAADGPLLLGSTIGPVLLAISAFVICWQYQLAKREAAQHWEAIPGKVVVWLGMAALTLLPWQWLTPPIAAAATAALSVLTYFAARRFDLKSLYAIVTCLQALAVVSFICTLHRSTDIQSNATLESGLQGMLAALIIAASILLTAGWSMAQSRRTALEKGFPPDWSAANSIAVTIGTGLVHLAMLFAISLEQAAIIWPLTASAALWVALRMSHTALAAFAGGLHLVSAGLFFYESGLADGSSGAVAPLAAYAHLQFLTPLVFGLTSWLCGNWIRSEERRLLASQGSETPKERSSAATVWFNYWCARAGALWLPVLWGLGWWLTAWLVETDRVLAIRNIHQYLTAATVTIVVVTSIAVSILARWRGWSQMGQVSLFTLPALVLSVGAGTILSAGELPSANLGFVAWPLALIWHLRILRLQERWLSPALCEVLHILGFWFFLLLASREGQLRFANLGEPYSSWSMLGWVVVPAVSFWLLRSSLLKNRWPLSEASGLRRAYMGIACTPVALYLLVWCFVSNLVSSGDAAPLPYVPVLNPLELGQWLVLAALMLWWRALPDESPAKISEGSIKTLAAGMGWFLLTAMVLRSCHHWAGVEWNAVALFDSRLAQAALSITWSIMGVLAMLFGNRRASRSVWFVGATLLAVVVIKLFLVELADRGGLYRIISFIGVGLLLLVVGYFAPVPVRASSLPDDQEGPEDSLAKVKA